MTEVYIGRQPIVDQRRAVHAYELLFRSDAEAFHAEESGDHATTQVIVNTFVEFGLDRLVHGRLAFVNLTRPFLVGTLPLPFPPTEAVLEVLEDVQADDALCSGVERLIDAGYRIALDDFVPDGPTARLLPLASYVKLDVLGVDQAELARQVKHCRQFDVKLIAERVETHEMFTACSTLGFDYFQGYFLATPIVERASTITPSTAICLELLGDLTQPNVSYETIEALVQVDIGLTYRILHAVNTAAVGWQRQVSSVREALVVLGMKQLRAWVLLMVLADAGNADPDQLSMAMTRARMCELLAAHVPGIGRDTAFTTGLLSTLDFLLGVPIDEVVRRLPLEATVTDALVRRGGVLGTMIDLAVAYEAADFERLKDSPVDLTDLARAYLSATDWSMRTCEDVLNA